MRVVAQEVRLAQGPDAQGLAQGVGELVVDERLGLPGPEVPVHLREPRHRVPRRRHVVEGDQVVHGRDMRQAASDALGRGDLARQAVAQEVIQPIGAQERQRCSSSG